ncbi:nuclear transport factor 2 family protein [Actinospica sp. MGRD01-02]|uniref:Nuclear transport factor 2 family protein n=1 Tax=Actinospica acidithermotolerans TaxID=2828514 RepID=A0A941EBF3_9ACTN|nr:nuclear transport factor 2 family protein [Actinospica acidithermotolerans]MBR7828466.1 nuclear transport factor 2 family protein [Actinospica acidithermotolerans]
MDAPATAVRALDETAAGNAEVVLRYLRVFETRQVEEFQHIVAEDVHVHGAGSHVRGRAYPESSVLSPGLSNCRVKVDDLFAAGDRVTVAATLTYLHDRSGHEATMSVCKTYRLDGGVIVEFWGETDLHGFLRQLGLAPAVIPDF